MIRIDAFRPQLKIQRINLDTGRENVVVISRRLKALRPDFSRGFQPCRARLRFKSPASNFTDH